MGKKVMIIDSDAGHHKDSDWFQNSDEGLGAEYEDKAMKDHKYFVKVKSKRFVELVRKNLGPSKKLSCIDIGCGTGETCVFLSRCFKRVVGVDYAPGMIRKAKKRKLDNCSFKVIDSSSLEFPENSFDVAVFFNVIHHIESKSKLSKALAEARRVVKQGGMVFVVDMNPFNPMTRHVINTNEIDAAVNLGGFKTGKFPTTLTPRECSSLYKKKRLKVISKEFLVFFPKILSFLLPLENLLKHIPFGGLYIIGGKK